MTTPTLLALCRLLRARAHGISREEACRRLEAPPALLDRALGELVRAGLVEERGGCFVPRPELPQFTLKMEMLYRHLNKVTVAKDMVHILLHPK